MPFLKLRKCPFEKYAPLPFVHSGGGPGCEVYIIIMRPPSAGDDHKKHCITVCLVGCSVGATVAEKT